jgi:hypothetical protein
MMVLSTMAVVASVAGCAGPRIVDGVFRSPKGYQVSVPAGAWVVARESRADLELVHRTEPIGMAINATCEPGRARASLGVLERHLLSGLRDRAVVSSEDTSLNGHVARHTVVDGQLGEHGAPVRVEAYVVRDGRCVYDLLYAAPAASFDDGRAGFQRLVDTFRTE